MSRLAIVIKAWGVDENFGIKDENSYKCKLLKATCSNNSGDVMVVTIDVLAGEY